MCFFTRAWYGKLRNTTPYHYDWQKHAKAMRKRRFKHQGSPPFADAPCRATSEPPGVLVNGGLVAISARVHLSLGPRKSIFPIHHPFPSFFFPFFCFVVLCVLDVFTLSFALVVWEFFLRSTLRIFHIFLQNITFFFSLLFSLQHSSDLGTRFGPTWNSKSFDLVHSNHSYTI